MNVTQCVRCKKYYKDCDTVGCDYCGDKYCPSCAEHGFCSSYEVAICNKCVEDYLPCDDCGDFISVDYRYYCSCCDRNLCEFCNDWHMMEKEEEEQEECDC